MPVAATSRGSECHEFLPTKCLESRVFRSALLEDIDSREHCVSPGDDTNKQTDSDSMETIIRDNPRRHSKMFGSGNASVRASVRGDDSMGTEEILGSCPSNIKTELLAKDRSVRSLAA